MSALKGLASPAYCLGDAESLKPPADALGQAGSELAKMKAEIERRIAEVVPGAWEGAGAQAFKDLVDREIRAVLELDHASYSLLNADNVLADGLSRAEQLYRQAQAAADQNNLVIDDRLVVSARVQTDESMAAAIEVQKVVDEARQMAEQARAIATDVFEKNHELLCQLRDAAIQAILSRLSRGRAGKRPGIKPVPKPPAAPAAPSSPKKWPKRSDFKTEREYGTAFHNAMKELERTMEGKEIAPGWRLAKVERTVGGRKRVDTMYINDEKKVIVVGDYYTGKTEPVAHAQKNWAYATEPEIQALRQQGYDYQAYTLSSHPDRLN